MILIRFTRRRGRNNCARQDEEKITGRQNKCASGGMRVDER